MLVRVLVDTSNAAVKAYSWIWLFSNPVRNIFMPSVLKLTPDPKLSWFLTCALSSSSLVALVIESFAAASFATVILLFSSTVAVLSSAVGADTPTIVIVIVAVVSAVSVSSSVSVYVKTSVTVNPESSVAIFEFAT